MVRDKDKRVHMTVEFIRQLAKTKDMRLFQTKFVQRFINFHWEHGYKTFLIANLVIFAVIFLLILVSVLLIHYPEGTI